MFGYIRSASCLLSSGGWNSVGMWVAFPPYQPWSRSGQGEGKLEQSSLAGHQGAPSCRQLPSHSPAMESCKYHWCEIVICALFASSEESRLLHAPIQAMPMLSVWMRGTGLRAQVEPAGTTAHTESSTNLPGRGCSEPWFHICPEHQ